MECINCGYTRSIIDYFHMSCHRHISNYRYSRQDRDRYQKFYKCKSEFCSQKKGAIGFFCMYHIRKSME